ncbi:MAG TPA: tetratricopeptide repeat protein [Firmicutes bacterium]|nr:tetratricopeptide repeat protein [Candidatus Fermentithermobacillaceae bacterium]
MKEPLRLSFRHVWNYVLLLTIISGLLLWRSTGLDGRAVFGAVVAWIVLGRVFMPWIIHEHIGFLNRWVFNDYEKAHKRYRQAVDSGRATANAYCALGSLAYAEGDTPEAVRLLEEAVERLPEDVPARAVLARALIRAGRVDEAFEVVHHCLRTASKNSLVYIVLGDVMAKKRDFAAAASAYQKALMLSPDVFECHLKLGETYLQLGHDKEAEEEFRKARVLSPENPDVLYWWGKILCAKGDRKSARKALQKALEQRPIGDHTYQVPYQEIIAALSSVNDTL